MISVIRIVLANTAAQTTVRVYHREEKVWLQFHTIRCKYLLSPFNCSVLPTGEQNLSTGSKKYVEVHAFVQKWPLVGSCGEKTRPCDFGYK